ncbi:hypothetical protein H6F78_13560 [Coleofasciculus sp. FACHB-64]|uniref:hypothetical protein n=1 Tax=Cyanophyceae TaxID=3028117 RepID=UPI0016867118|nr:MULTISPECIES: hypothetical protein [unclassified Coleofasciculus]MBD1877882.1 hypothetical protein [Coleofasciculus sp. FACHB-T130]MBD2046605.1 hypothetical protein [Coleofasciculus sp. FACHB-64]MBD2541679.1 hypothetical protein [Coleofasciculus sp. FACHB-SPT36]
MTNDSSNSQEPDESELRQLRSAYVGEVQALSSIVEELQAAGRTNEEIAIEVHRRRREIGVKYKKLTPPKEREEIYRRNLQLYGDELGPTIDYFRTVQNKTWEKIIESATKTNAEYNKKFGLE